MPRALAVSRVLVVFAGVCLAGAPASAQAVMGVQRPGDPAVQPPPRDRTPQTGTAILRGRVIGADSGQPLRRAQVRLFAPELRGGRVTSTDAEGRYEFKELPAGRYTVAASKGSYVSLQYGQTRPLEPGKPLEIRDGQVVEKVDFGLPRGGVITGRVFDEFGEPVSDVQVAVQRYQYMQGSRRLVNAGRPGMTNDIGEFRVFGLPPGQYYLSATLRAVQMADSDDHTGYAPTYYPGAPNPETAQRLTLGIGQTLNDLVMTLTPTRTARITGAAVASDGKPMTGMIMLMQRSGFGFSSRGAPLGPGGTFSIGGVAPGEYVLRTAGPQSNQQEFAQADVTVSGEDVTGLLLVATKAVTIAGRIVVEPAAAAAFRPSSYRLFLAPVQPEMMMGGNPPGTVNDDLTFSMKVRPGKMRIGLSGGSTDTRFTVRAVHANGVDVIDTGLDIRANEDVTGIEIELTTRVSEVSGVVTDTRGAPLKDYSVVVFPQDRDRWTAGSRYLRSGRPDQEGRFRITPLPPGEYEAVALDYVEPGEATDPEFLDRIRASATPFSIGEGESKVMTLRISSSS